MKVRREIGRGRPPLPPFACSRAHIFAYLLLPKQVDCEFEDTCDGLFWRQTLTTYVTWLSLSNQKGELTWSHSFSSLDLLFAHQSGQSFYMALKGCNRKRIHRLIAFPRTKVSLFGWQRTPFCILLDLAYLRNVTTRVYHNDTMFTSSYQCLPKTAILFIIFCCCCWTFPYILSKVPCSLSEFISVICLTTCWPFWFDKQRHVT